MASQNKQTKKTGKITWPDLTALKSTPMKKRGTIAELGISFNISITKLINPNQKRKRDFISCHKNKNWSQNKFTKDAFESTAL